MIKRLFTVWEEGYSLRSFKTKQEAHDWALSMNIADYEIRYKGHPCPLQQTMQQTLSTPALY